ncbi:MAG: hypothetical protein IPN17_24555 [Deltaproteobacteria bacterium]|nr:hypothetical protein [Deltaproteobacteria bacterium]
MAGPRTLRLREYDRALSVELTPEEVRVLRESRAELKVLATGIAGRYDIETAQHVGTIVGSSLRVLIEPKISMSRALYLVGYATEAMRIGAVTQLGQDADLLSAMQVLFAEALDRALYGGLVRDYRGHEEALVAPRGRIGIEALVTRRFGVFPPVDCAFDEYTVDTSPNRRLLAAARRMTRGMLGRSVAGERLRGLIGRFEGVAEPAFDPRHLPPVRLDRRAERYRPAVAFADLILRNASVELHHGYTDAIGFLVNMNVVFENFVVEALRRRLAVAGTRWTHHPAGLFLDEGRAFAVEPDALWTTADGRPLLVLDAKYKTTSQGVIQDAYQMLAYCTALGLSSGVLVYASTTPHTHRVRNTATDIITLGLDPSGEIPEVERAIDELAERLRTLVPGWAVA